MEGYAQLRKREGEWRLGRRREGKEEEEAGWGGEVYAR